MKRLPLCNGTISHCSLWGRCPKKEEDKEGEKEEEALEEEGEGWAAERVVKGHKMAEEMSFPVVKMVFPVGHSLCLGDDVPFRLLSGLQCN